MTIKQIVRLAEKHARAVQRESERAAREAERAAIAHYKAVARAQHQMHAVTVVRNYESYIRSLTSYHLRTAGHIDWYAQLHSPPPSPPVRQDYMERAATEALRKYAPTFVDRLLGRDGARKEELERGVGIARLSDDRIFTDAQREYQARYQEWLEWHSLSQRVCGKDTAVYPEILNSFGIFTTFIELGIQIHITGISPDMIALSTTGPLGAIIPETEFTLTSTGKVASKSLAKAKYWSLMQDHICSCALRIASDVFNILPIRRLTLNLGETRINSATGHPESVTLLGLDISCAALKNINLAAVDPSDAMVNFNVRWKFNKTKGFAPVRPVSPQDGWISAP